MKKCSRCQAAVEDGDGWILANEFLCDDCYIDRRWPPIVKTFHANDPAEFMRRLKESYPVHPQKFH